MIGYDTHDTQYGVYLYYAPDTFSHVHRWSDWTDTGDGETHARTCSAAGCAVSTQSASHRWREGRVLKAPTCTEEGQRQMICTDCGARKTAAIPVLGHSWGSWTYSDEAVHTRTCTRCGAVHPSENHVWGDELEWVDEQYHARVCSVCDGQLKGEHIWGEMQISTPATCQQSGLGWIGCTICERGSYETIPQLDHEFGDWTMVDDKTHTSTCTFSCGTAKTEDHDLVEEVLQAPDYGIAGQKHIYCTKCAYREEFVEMPPLETCLHACTNCGLCTLPAEKGFCMNGEKCTCGEDSAPLTTEALTSSTDPAAAADDTKVIIDTAAWNIPVDQTVSMDGHQDSVQQITVSNANKNMGVITLSVLATSTWSGDSCTVTLEVFEEGVSVMVASYDDGKLEKVEYLTVDDPTTILTGDNVKVFFLDDEAHAPIRKAMELQP